MIVTLAGHVDHGKTSLVHALSGVDTDRLAEEKQRGLTIDLGFAYIDQGNIGFVDVPGHHKFIHNMVAGVASRQHAMLVIAADDGPMPQSREHLDILSLIGVDHGCIALTKTDRVDAARLDECREEIQQLVANSFLSHAPVFATSINQPESFEPLLQYLRETATGNQQQLTPTPARLAIDRAFNIRGVGLIVTGTLHCGELSLNQTLTHFPSGRAVRIRSLHAQDQPAETAVAGDRCALNLGGLELDEVKRGHWLHQQPILDGREVSVKLAVTANFPRAVKHWTPVHVYHATSHSTGRIALLQGGTIAPGGQQLVDVLLDEPLPACRGDQLVLRDQSLDVTLGGGEVLMSSPTVSPRRRAPQRLSQMAAFAEVDAADALAGLLKLGPCDVDEFACIRQLSEDLLREQLDLIPHRSQGKDILSEALWQQGLSEATQAVTAHQQQQPTSSGLQENQFQQLPPRFRQAMLNELVQQGQLENSAGYFHLPQKQTQLPPDLEQLWQRLEPALDQLQPPSSGDLSKQWRMPLHQLEGDLKALSKLGLLTHIANHRYYLPHQLTTIAERVADMAQGKPISVREVRDALSIGRNVAIEVLEYFDRRGFTKRQGNERVLLRSQL